MWKDSWMIWMHDTDYTCMYENGPVKFRVRDYVIHFLQLKVIK